MTVAARAAILAAFLGAVAFARAAPPDFALRVVNGKDGPIQVRLSEDDAWVSLGRVLVPAARTAAGFGAARWAHGSTVAATAVHGIRIKVGGGEFPALISLVPREFARIPEFYGGHIPGDSGIRTDIGAGRALFREWAPVVGSLVSLELAGGELPLPDDYKPAAGDVLIIRVSYPRGGPRSIEFENREGGEVIAVSSDQMRTPIGTVTQPARGVGRFDGTSYTGIGSVNTNHPGVITVSTAPWVDTERDEGAPPERRGGFMISPSAHTADQAKGMPQVMAVAPLPGDPPWEGRFPLFSGAIGLLDGPAGFRVEMRTDADWEPLPAIRGRDDVAFTPERLSAILGRKTPEGARAFRLTMPPWDAGAARRRLSEAAGRAPRMGKEPTGVYRPISGRIPVQAKGASGAVSFLVDGRLRAASNNPEYRWIWDTTAEPVGRHWLEVVSRSGARETRQLQRVYVTRATPSAP